VLSPCSIRRESGECNATYRIHNTRVKKAETLDSGSAFLDVRGR